MPNRIIRKGYVDSEHICALSDWSHRVYSNLLIVCDDAGRFDGRAEYLRSHLFPLGTARRTAEIETAIAEIEKCDLLIRYEVNGKPFLQLLRWQRAGKAKTSKFPWRDGGFGIQYTARPSPDGDGMQEYVLTSLPNAMHTPSAPHTDGVRTESGESHTYSETETETETLFRQAEEQKPSRASTDESPRPADPLWDAVASAWFGGQVAKPHRKRAGKIVCDLRDLGATPATLATVRNAYRIKWPNIAETPESIVKHWCSLVPQSSRQAQPDDEESRYRIFRETDRCDAADRPSFEARQEQERAARRAKVGAA